MDFVKLAYRYYPKGISDADNRYRESAENKRRLKRILVRPKFHTIFLDICNQVVKDHSNCLLSFDDYTLVGKYDACVKGTFAFQKGVYFGMVGLYISLLVPYYCRTRSVHTKHYDSGVNLIYQSVYETIEDIMVQRLPRFHLMDQKNLDETVKDVMFDGKGCLDEFVNKADVAPLTVLSAFFSDLKF